MDCIATADCMYSCFDLHLQFLVHTTGLKNDQGITLIIIINAVYNPAWLAW